VIRTVQVALPLPLHQTFTYTVPPDWPAPLPGCRVRVPFGRLSLTGLIVEEPPPGTLPERLKPLRSLLDREPFLPPDLLAFTRWLADYYLAPWGLVLRGACPPGLAPEAREKVALTAEGASSGEARFAPLREALGRNPRSASSLLATLGPGSEVLLTEALRQGHAVVEERLTAVRRRSGRDRVVLLKSPEEASALSRDESLPKAFRKVLALLLTYQDRGYPEAASLARAVRVPHYTLTEMAEAGLVELFDLLPAHLAARPSPHDLTADQESCVAAVRATLDGGTHRTFLLYGVTGSGKTEVYLRLIETVLERGRTALFLVPEISLTSLLARRLIERFGSTVALLHSSMGEKERSRQWLRARSGSARVMIGPRSALFAPLPDLGLVVVDEEHDGSYKQQEHPRYHARDMAVLRGVQAGVPVILGSATPSAESYYNATDGGKYTLLTLSERAGGAALPAVEVVDMRREYEQTGGPSILSRALSAALTRTLGEKRQAVILRNRTGFATFVLCRPCGKTLQCPDCAVAFTYHRKAGHLRCHYCGRTATVPAVCPECGGEFLQFLGTGTEKVEDLLGRDLPEARVGRMDRDAVRTAAAFDRLWLDFETGEIDILVGTQMVAKGHDIHNVTLVGILSADFLLSMPDFRAAERTFQLITQAAGRAGRGTHAGTVILQSFHPDHYAVQAAAAQDFGAFYSRDIHYRRIVGYPPFSALARIEVRHEDHSRVGALSTQTASLLRTLAGGEVKVLGPSPAFLARLEGKYRHHILLKSPTRARLKALLTEFLGSPLASHVGRELDLEVDPTSML